MLKIFILFCFFVAILKADGTISTPKFPVTMCAERVCVGYEEDITAWWVYKDKIYSESKSQLSGDDYIVVYPKSIRLCSDVECTDPLDTLDLTQLGSPASTPHSMDFNGKKALNINYTISDPSFPDLEVKLATYLLEQQTILPQPAPDDNDLYEIYENDFVLAYEWTYLNLHMDEYYLEFSTQIVHLSGCFMGNTTGNSTVFEFETPCGNVTDENGDENQKKVGYAVAYPLYGINHSGTYEHVNITSDSTNTTTFVVNYPVGSYSIVIESGFQVSTGWVVALCILAVFVIVILASVGGFYAWRWWKKRKFKKITSTPLVDEGEVQWDKVENW